MTTQNKIIKASRITLNTTEDASTCLSITFDTMQSQNIHGMTVTMGVSPNGPDETLVGRWYVLLLPHSIEDDPTVRNAWIDNLDTITAQNNALEGTEFVWGAGTIMCAEQSTFQHTFAPSTSRNIKKGAVLRVVFVADAISGVADDWDGSAMVTLFTS